MLSNCACLPDQHSRSNKEVLYVAMVLVSQPVNCFAHTTNQTACSQKVGSRQLLYLVKTPQAAKEGMLCLLCLMKRSQMFNRKNRQHRVLQSIHAKWMLDVVIQHFACITTHDSSVAAATRRGSILQQEEQHLHCHLHSAAMQGAQCTSTVLVHDHSWSVKAMHCQTKMQPHTRKTITPR